MMCKNLTLDLADCVSLLTGCLWMVALMLIHVVQLYTMVGTSTGIK